MTWIYFNSKGVKRSVLNSTFTLIKSLCFVRNQRIGFIPLLSKVWITLTCGELFEACLGLSTMVSCDVGVPWLNSELLTCEITGPEVAEAVGGRSLNWWSLIPQGEAAKLSPSYQISGHNLKLMLDTVRAR